MSLKELEEAIYKLRNTPVDVVVGDALEFALAKRLGIEALERVKYNSTARFGEYDYSPLPSEGEKSV